MGYENKEDAQRLIQNASVIFLCGGNTVLQNDFLVEYELSDAIKNSNAFIMGASAGALQNGYARKTLAI